MTALNEEPVEVRIEALPLALVDRVREHVDDLRRELALMAHASEPDPNLPRRLVTLLDDLEQTYEEVSNAQQTQLEAATSSGADTVDMTLLVPREVAEVCIQLAEVLEEADRYCADGGYLLNLVSPPEVVAFRRWYLGEFVRQIRGEPPMAWRGAAAANG